MDRVISPVNLPGFSPVINTGWEGCAPITCEIVVVIWSQACEVFPSKLHSCLPLYSTIGYGIWAVLSHWYPPIAVMANSADRSEPGLPINVKARRLHNYPDSWTVLWVWLHLTQNFPLLHPLSLPSCLVGWKLQAVSPLGFPALLVLCVFADTSVCVCAQVSVCVHVHNIPLALCFQGVVWMPLVINSVLILPEIRPKMWLPCERFSWGQFWKEQIQQELLTGPQSSAIS